MGCSTKGKVPPAYLPPKRTKAAPVLLEGARRAELGRERWSTQEGQMSRLETWEKNKNEGEKMTATGLSIAGGKRALKEVNSSCW